MNIDEKYQEYRRIITTNQDEYASLKANTLKIINQRHLVSMMNDSKWIKLLDAVEFLDFPPAFLCKTLNDEIDQLSESKFMQEIPWYWGNWKPYYHEAMPIFMNIEYFIVKPLLSKHQGQWVDDLIYDQTEQFRKILCDLNILFSEQNHCFKINAYIEP